MKVKRVGSESETGRQGVSIRIWVGGAERDCTMGIIKMEG